MDKCGEPYCLHPEAVAGRCRSPLAKAVAYLHDVVEDTGLTGGELEAMGVPRKVVRRVELLTKPEGAPYMDYVGKVSEDPVAAEVKYCDLKHNTDLTRTGGKMVVSEGKWQNYQQALQLLNDKYHFE